MQTLKNQVEMNVLQVKRRAFEVHQTSSHPKISILRLRKRIVTKYEAAGLKLLLQTLTNISQQKIAAKAVNILPKKNGGALKKRTLRRKHQTEEAAGATLCITLPLLRQAIEDGKKDRPPILESPLQLEVRKCDSLL